MKVREVSSITLARTNVSTGQEADRSSAMECCVHKMKDVLFRHVLFVHSNYRS